MKRFVVLDKKIGETPLAALEKWRSENPKYAEVSASYAGRLDPMASGKLLILLGDECKRQRAYTNLDKEYEIEVLLDLSSDTGDVLGMPEYAHKETAKDVETLAALRCERGVHLRDYPIFSSKTVQGKPLFLHALEGNISSIEIPEHIEHIYSIKNQSSYIIPLQELKIRIHAFLDLVPRTQQSSKRLGEDFRVNAIRAQWESILNKMPERNFTVLRLRVTCASGTYMRSLAGRIGFSLGTQALALSIKRTNMGTYFSLGHGMGCWLRTY